MDNLDFYDEFGNYNGPDLSDTESHMDVDPPSPTALPPSTQQQTSTLPVAILSTEITLHEDKQYYPSAMQVYGPGVETIVHDEDLQPLSMPIIAPLKQPKSYIKERALPQTTYSKDFLKDLMGFPELTRCVGVVGGLGSGKTGVVDMLVNETHGTFCTSRYTDVHEIERYAFRWC